MNVRLPAAEKAALRQIAFVAGLSVSALVRRRCWGRRVAIDPVPGVMEYLRRASVEIHAAQPHAGDRDRTHARAEAALGWLREAMNLLGQDEAGMGGASVIGKKVPNPAQSNALSARVRRLADYIDAPETLAKLAAALPHGQAKRYRVKVSVEPVGQ